MKNLAIFISGGGSNMKSIIAAIEEGRIKDAKVQLVVSSSSEAGGLIFAEDKSIKTEVISYKSKPEGKIAAEILELLRENDIDYIILAGFVKVIPAEVVSVYKRRIMNIHPSLIPLFCGKGYYGIIPHQAAIGAGVRESGATVHFVDEGVDTGTIILQEKCPVYEGDSAEELQKRVLKIEHEIYPRAIAMVLSGEVE